MSVITRRIQCHQCGAAHQVLDDALMVLCEHCGSFVALRADKGWGGEAIARRQAEAIRSMIAPTAAESRKLRAQLAMADAVAASDRETWRLWAREYYAVLPITNPERVPGDHDDPRQMARWVRQSLEAARLCTFDPTVRAAQGAFAAAAGALHRAEDPLAASRELLARAEQMFETITTHPEYPDDLAAASPSHMARELLRSTLVGAASMLGPGVVARIQREVLGDEDVQGSALRCESCGASLETRPGDQRCPFCGAVLHVQTEDPWLDNLLGLWEASRAQAHDDTAEALLVLTLSLSSHLSGRALPEPSMVWRLLAAGPAWLPRSSLRDAIGLARHAYGEDPRVLPWLDALAGELPRWQPRGERATTSCAPVEPSPDRPADPGEDPWVLQSLALWEHGRDTYTHDPSSLASAVIGFVLQPFYLGGSISLSQALAFIEAMEPRPSSASLAQAAELMRQADVAPAASSLLQGLAAALRRPSASS